MRTLLLPTTVGVNEMITMQEALNILKSNGIEFEVAGEIVDGMYLAENGEIVKEQLLPIASDMLTANELAVIFTQECILESDGNSAQLVAQNGDVWANFGIKVDYDFRDIATAIAYQEKLAKHFGGSSRIGGYVWAWGNEENVSQWAV